MSDENEINVLKAEKMASPSKQLNQGGCKIETKISPKVLSQAQRIAEGNTGGEDLPIDVTLDYEGSINIKNGLAKFYRINITKEDLDNGVMILSTSSDKFNVAFFDRNGKLFMSKESEDATEGFKGNFFFLTSKIDQNDMIAEKKVSNYYEYILPGNYIFCVCLNGGDCTLSCLKAQPSYKKCAERIKIEVNDIQVKQTEIGNLELKLQELKKQKDGIKKEAKELIEDTEKMISKRVKLYENLLS